MEMNEYDEFNKWWEEHGTRVGEKEIAQNAFFAGILAAQTNSTEYAHVTEQYSAGNTLIGRTVVYSVLRKDLT